MEPRGTRGQPVVKGVCGLPRRPGWEAISAAADRTANDTDWRARHKFESGALDFRTSIAVDLEIGGMRLFAGKLADETCDRCGRPGEQVTSGEAAVAGTRCVRCRGLDDRVVPRTEWTLPERAVPVIDPATEKRYSRPITEYWNKGRLEALMNAHHEPGDSDGSAICGTNGGWNHVLRALLAAWIDPDAGQGAGRLRIDDLKQKWGSLSIMAGPLNEVRWGAQKLAIEMSTRICEQCGAPGTRRNPGVALWGIGTTCDRCEAQRAADAALPLGAIRRILFDRQRHTGSPLSIEDAIAESIEESGLTLETYVVNEKKRRCRH